jgi:hypothetical protein
MRNKVMISRCAVMVGLVGSLLMSLPALGAAVKSQAQAMPTEQRIEIVIFLPLRSASQDERGNVCHGGSRGATVFWMSKEGTGA